MSAFEEKREQYLREHKACPKCGRTRFYVTLTWGHFACECGWSGYIRAMVPVRGDPCLRD